MTDTAFEMLASAINAESGAAILWVVDENLSASQLERIVVTPHLRAITNRVDIQQRLVERNIAVELSDFEFRDCAPGSVDVLAYRISKEKAIVHHVINRAPELLREGGRLLLAGAKNEGIKTYTDKAAAYCGGSVAKQRGRGSTLLSGIETGEHPGAPLDDRNYRDEIAVTARLPDGEALELLSKPGLYGWNKIDRGSEFLIEHLPEVLPQLQQPQVVVDLGCGFGYLSVMAARIIPATFIATDNNVAAVTLCRRNFARHQVAGEVVLADCGNGIDPRADLVLCNPPFHQGFGTDGDLTRRFVTVARQLLTPGGAAFFVVNSFIGLEREAETLFSSCERVANNGKFKLILLR